MTVAVAAFLTNNLAGSGPAGASGDRNLQAEDEEVTLDFVGCSTNLRTDETTCIPDGERATERALCDEGEVLAWMASTGRNNTGRRGHECVPRPCTAGYDNEGPRYKANHYAWSTNSLSWVDTFHRCDVKLFDLDNQQGAASVWIDGHPGGVNLRTIENGLNNRANSYRLS